MYQNIKWWKKQYGSHLFRGKIIKRPYFICRESTYLKKLKDWQLINYSLIWYLGFLSHFNRFNVFLILSLFNGQTLYPCPKSSFWEKETWKFLIWRLARKTFSFFNCYQPLIHQSIFGLVMTKNEVYNRQNVKNVIFENFGHGLPIICLLY